MLWLDISIIILLIFTIVYLWRLNKKVTELRQTKGELARLIRYFDDSIMRAEMSIDELKHLSGKTGSDFEQKLEKAKFFSDDLAFMTDRASNIADKLEQIIGSAREFEKNTMMKQNPAHKPSYNPSNPSLPVNNRPAMPQAQAPRAQAPVYNKETQPNLYSIDEEKRAAIESLLDKISKAGSTTNTTSQIKSDECFKNEDERAYTVVRDRDRVSQKHEGSFKNGIWYKKERENA